MEICFVPVKNERQRLGKYFWRIQSETTTIYLLGTVHLLSKKFFPLKAEIMNAFDRADHFVCEVALDDEDMNISTVGDSILEDSNYTYPSNDSLYQHFKKEDITQLKERLVKLKYCSPMIAAQFHRLKPKGINALIMNGILKDAGIDPRKMGIDALFTKRARGMNKSIIQLETKKFQEQLIEAEILSPLEKMGGKDCLTSNALEIEDDNVLPSISIGKARVLKYIFKIYSKGVKKVYNTIEATDYSSVLSKEMIQDRNKEMAKKIEGYLKTGETYFIAVGALHLLSKESIIETLEHKGYVIKRIY